MADCGVYRVKTGGICRKHEKKKITIRTKNSDRGVMGMVGLPSTAD